MFSIKLTNNKKKRRKNAGKFLTKRARRAMIFQQSRDAQKAARVVELADSLDSGSSAHYGRAGSSPASRTIEKTLFFGY